LLTGSASNELAYQLERKMFDNGHATTVLETPDRALINAIKNAGLICLCVNASAELVDVSLDTNILALDDIYSLLKDKKIIF
jgi:bifunctional enzyme CysN/CysC